MLNNRGPIAPSGGINFKSGDISGTAAKTADDRASQGTEYFRQDTGIEVQKNGYIDRSTELYAALDSLALINASCIVRNQNKKSILADDEDMEALIKPVEDEEENEEHKNGREKEENSASNSSPADETDEESAGG